MNRGFVRAIMLAAATLAASFAIRAAAPAAASLERWQDGVHYTQLRTPVPPEVRRGRVVVNEVFWYGCSHCYALDPALESWKTSKPAYIDFVRIPVVWGPAHAQHARLFYTLQALKRDDLHPKVFATIHENHNMLAAQTDADARALQLEFLRDNGVTEEKFNAAYDSPAVIENVNRARSLTGRMEVGSVPLMVVQGKYVTSVSQAGNDKKLLELVVDLAASEKGR